MPPHRFRSSKCRPMPQPPKRQEGVWLDTTSRSQHETAEQKAEVRAVEIRHDLLVIHVSRHLHYPGEWIYRCPALDIDVLPLGNISLEEAKAEAIRRVYNMASLLFASASALHDVTGPAGT